MRSLGPLRLRKGSSAKARDHVLLTGAATVFLHRIAEAAKIVMLQSIGYRITRRNFSGAGLPSRAPLGGDSNRHSTGSGQHLGMDYALIALLFPIGLSGPALRAS